MMELLLFLLFFFFNDTATTEIYTLSLHDALPIYPPSEEGSRQERPKLDEKATKLLAKDLEERPWATRPQRAEDRKSTRLNSSHANISYAVFCLKKKKQPNRHNETQLKLIRR